MSDACDFPIPHIHGVLGEFSSQVPTFCKLYCNLLCVSTLSGNKSYICEMALVQDASPAQKRKSKRYCMTGKCHNIIADRMLKEATMVIMRKLLEHLNVVRIAFKGTVHGWGQV